MLLKRSKQYEVLLNTYFKRINIEDEENVINIVEFKNINLGSFFKPSFIYKLKSIYNNETILCEGELLVKESFFGRSLIIDYIKLKGSTPQTRTHVSRYKLKLEDQLNLAFENINQH